MQYPLNRRRVPCVVSLQETSTIYFNITFWFSQLLFVCEDFHPPFWRHGILCRSCKSRIPDSFKDAVITVKGLKQRSAGSTRHARSLSTPLSLTLFQWQNAARLGAYMFSFNMLLVTGLKAQVYPWNVTRHTFQQSDNSVVNYKFDKYILILLLKYKVFLMVCLIATNISSSLLTVASDRLNFQNYPFGQRHVWFWDPWHILHA
jgi:hypothetical protein